MPLTAYLVCGTSFSARYCTRKVLTLSCTKRFIFNKQYLMPAEPMKDSKIKGCEGQRYCFTKIGKAFPAHSIRGSPQRPLAARGVQADDAGLTLCTGRIPEQEQRPVPEAEVNHPYVSGHRAVAISVGFESLTQYFNTMIIVCL